MFYRKVRGSESLSEESSGNFDRSHPDLNRSRLRSKTSSIKKGAAKVWRPVGYRLSQEGAPNGLQTLSDRFPISEYYSWYGARARRSNKTERSEFCVLGYYNVNLDTSISRTIRSYSKWILGYIARDRDNMKRDKQHLTIYDEYDVHNMTNLLICCIMCYTDSWIRAFIGIY